MGDQTVNKLVEMVFGSHLYGTDTPQSDHDFKGVYLPTMEDACLGRMRDTVSFKRSKADGEKNTSNDIDTEFFSLQKFVRMACEGQTVAIDMLHAREDMLKSTSDVWEWLRSNRGKFYSKNMNAFIGYAQRQAAKYGIKGSRLACAKAWLEMLRAHENLTVSELVECMSMSADYVALKDDLWHHAKLIDPAEDDNVAVEIVGKRLTKKAKCGYYVDVLAVYVATYGARARQAQANEGVDWKAMSHAVRAGIQVRKILDPSTYGELVLPFSDPIAYELRYIKQGMLPFARVQERLEGLIEDAKQIAMYSNLPDRVDHADFEEFVIAAMCVKYDW